MTQEYLKEHYLYDQDTGLFTVIKKRNGNKYQIGHIINGSNVEGYRRISYKKKVYTLHRMAFLYVNGTIPQIVDHIDRDVQNNKWSNLREVTHSGNIRNRGKKSTNTTGRRGVFEIRKGYFQGVIFDNDNKRITFGNKDKQKVIDWRNNKEIEYGFYQ